MNSNISEFKRYCEKVLKQHLNKKKTANKKDFVKSLEDMSSNAKLAQTYLQKGVKSMTDEANKILSSSEDNPKLKKELEDIIKEYASKSTLFIKT